MREVASLDLLLKEAAGLNLTPAWIEYDDPLFRSEAQSRFIPAHWRYDEMKALLDAAGHHSERYLQCLRRPNPGASHHAGKDYGGFKSKPGKVMIVSSGPRLAPWARVSRGTTALMQMCLPPTAV